MQSVVDLPKPKLPQPMNMPIDGREFGLSRSRTYVLVEDYSYEWEHKGLPYRIIVPGGFLYDGASVPRSTWTVSGLRPDGLLRAAATVHDFIYEYQGKMPPGSYQSWDSDLNGWVDVKQRWTRKSADKMFGRLMREAGMSRYRRRMAYRAVRLAGGVAWKT